MAFLDESRYDAHRPSLMRRAGLTDRDRRRRSAVTALAASLALVIMVAATNSVVSAARTISRESSALSETDGSIRSATVARTLTVLAAVAVQGGSTPSGFAEIDIAIADLASRSAIGSPSAEFIEAVDSTVGMLSSGAPAGPEQIAAVENTFQQLLDVQLSRRRDLADALESSRSRLEHMSTLSGVALLFIVPAVAIFVYRGLTKPDLDHAAIIHDADIQQARSTERRRAIGTRLAQLRDHWDHHGPPHDGQQQLAELAALLGPGGGGEARDRGPVDVRWAAASAVGRVGLRHSCPVSGDDASALGDEEDLVTLLAALIGCVNDLDSPAIIVNQTAEFVVVSVSGVGCLEESPMLDDVTLWDTEPVDGIDLSLAAARSLAENNGARLNQVTRGDRCGFSLRLTAATSDRSNTWRRGRPVAVA